MRVTEITSPRCWGLGVSVHLRSWCHCVLPVEESLWRRKHPGGHEASSGE